MAQASAASDSYLTPGSVLLDKYRVETILGQGGMGTVVLATHIHLEEKVAIKFVRRDLAADKEIVHRFLQEGRAAIKIRSQHCVRVFDIGTLDTGEPFMVMEFLEGHDLDSILQADGPLPIAVAVDYVLQACEALAEAHALGIIHRDLKPANLFVARTPDGTPCVKVLDFGISKTSKADLGMTGTRAIFGSPRYMSPEQMRSARDVDARADVWALGTVLFEALTGNPPFDGDSFPALTMAVFTEAAPLAQSRRPDVPPGLDEAIKGALEKDREKRYPSVAELAAALMPYGTDAARASAERIARVLGRTGTLRTLPRPPDPPPLSLQKTELSQPQLPHPPLREGHRPARGNPVVWVGLIGGLVAIAGGLFAVASRSSTTHPPEPPPAASSAIGIVSETPPPPPPPPVPTVVAPEATTGAAPAEAKLAMATAAAVPPATRATRPSPTASSPPSAKPPSQPVEPPKSDPFERRK